MEAVELKPGVYWVGYIDWSLREFHGYSTPRGTTYNAYLIVDEQVTLVDTVKEYGFWELVERVAGVVDPEDIDNIVVNHVEMDHSGSLPLLMDLVPNATIITSARGKQFLEQHYGEEWDYHLVSTGDELSIGENTLTFVQMPMVHWPDSMATYVEEKKLLLPNDAFGQHIASAERFDDQLGWAVIYEEAAKYYANIVLPFGGPVKNALKAVSDLDFDMVGPSHGIVWRLHLPDIIEAYKRWSGNETEDRAVVVYDTMWGSTELIARELVAGLEEVGIPTVLRSLHTSDRSDIMTDVLSSKAVLVGSPTFNNQLLPSVAALLTYMKALKPKKRVGLAFGSYGWSGEGAHKVQEAMDELGWELPLETINIKFVPGDEELESAREAGRALGRVLVGEEQGSPSRVTGGGEMDKYRCTVCGYVYDPEEGDPDNGVEPGTPFADLPDDWVCPVCGAPKNKFEKIG